ncbi:MAG: hypothetical protein AAFU79_12130 [Myxococcota bacterium]
MQARFTVGRERAIVEEPERTATRTRRVRSQLVRRHSDEAPESRFRALVPRVEGFLSRLSDPEQAVRMRLLTELTRLRPRDARYYPPLFRHLLRDPAGSIRWAAARRLSLQLGPRHPFEVPASLEVPVLGVVDPLNEKSVAQVRRKVEGAGRLASSLELLGVLADEASQPLFTAYLDHGAPALRLRAAFGSLQVGLVDEGLAVLRSLAQVSPRGEAPMLPVLAAEAMVRAGDRSGLDRLVAHARCFPWETSPFGPCHILEDLTGVHHRSVEQWAAYVDETSTAVSGSRAMTSSSMSSTTAESSSMSV